MNGAALLIMLIVSLTLAAGGAYLITQVGSDAQEDVRADVPDTTVQVVNVIAQNISSGAAKHVRISMRTDGPVRLNDTRIVLRTENDTAHLQYRDGSLERNMTGGFHTQ